MKVHIRRAHPDQTTMHNVDEQELLYYEPSIEAIVEDEVQSAVSGHDNSLTAAAASEETMEAPGDDNQFLLYNIRDHM